MEWLLWAVGAVWLACAAGFAYMVATAPTEQEVWGSEVTVGFHRATPPASAASDAPGGAD